MEFTRTLVERFGRGGVPVRSVRLRLTALYGGLFLICGAALLAITYLLVRHGTQLMPGRVPRLASVAGQRTVRLPADVRQLFAALRYQNAADLHQLLEESAIALAGMAMLSVALGWVVAGRVLSPLRTITATTRRISAHRLHERLALSGPRDELKELADTIDELLSRLEAAFDAQRRFVANAAHELRTPLAMMRTRLDVAVAKPDGVPPQTQALDAGLRRDLDRVEALLQSFLMLARAGHGTLPDRTIVSLDRIVTNALATRLDQITERKLEVRTALDSVGVAGSETLLTRMVENVVENSVRHNQARGFVEVKCETIGAATRLVVETGGPVLDEQSVTRLAEPFRRFGAERTGSPNGQGLGLSIVAAIADAHDGALELRPRREGGLCVQITLPSAGPSPARPVVA